MPVSLGKGFESVSGFSEVVACCSQLDLLKEGRSQSLMIKSDWILEDNGRWRALSRVLLRESDSCEIV